MISKPIRVLVADANPSGEEDLRSQMDQIPEVEIVGIAHSQRATLTQVESTQPDFSARRFDAARLPEHRAAG